MFKKKGVDVPWGGVVGCDGDGGGDGDDISYTLVPVPTFNSAISA